MLSERALETEAPERAKFDARTEAGDGGRARAENFHVVGGVGDVADARVEREALGERVFAVEVEIEPFGPPGVGAGLDAAAGRNGGAALETAVVPVRPEAVALAVQAHAPTRGARHKTREVAGSLRTDDALRRAIHEDRHAARPTREKRERLFVAEIQAFHPHRAVEVVLRRDRVAAVDVGIETVEFEKLRGRRKNGAAEEIFEIAPEAAERELANAREVILEPRVEGARAPRLDAHVAQRDLVVGRGIFRIGQRDAAGVLVVVGAADRRVPRGAGDEVFAEIVASIDAREQREVFFLRLGPAVEEGELRNPERVSGRDERERPTVGAEDGPALRIALDVARGISERALGGDVCLLGAESGDELQPIV